MWGSLITQFKSNIACHIREYVKSKGTNFRIFEKVPFLWPNSKRMWIRGLCFSLDPLYASVILLHAATSDSVSVTLAFILLCGVNFASVMNYILYKSSVWVWPCFHFALWRKFALVMNNILYNSFYHLLFSSQKLGWGPFCFFSGFCVINATLSGNETGGLGHLNVPVMKTEGWVLYLYVWRKHFFLRCWLCHGFLGSSVSLYLSLGCYCLISLKMICMWF